jgi:hypothetical protein
MHDFRAEVGPAEERNAESRIAFGVPGRRWLRESP